MDISVTGVPDVQALLKTAGKQAPKAVQLWCSWVGLTAQGEMRKELPRRFQLRGTKTVFDRAIVYRAPTAKRIRAELVIGGTKAGTGSATQRMGQMLARHEEGETRAEAGRQIYFDSRGRAMTGLGFYVAARGLRTSTANPSRKMYPSAIGASIRALAGGSKVGLASSTKKRNAKKGTGESFFATKIGIFRRTHSGIGQSSVEPLWLFRKRIHTPARLGLWKTADQVFRDRGVALGVQAVEEAIFRATL